MIVKKKFNHHRPAPRVALVHEWLSLRAGSEKVVEELFILYPEATLFVLVDAIPVGPDRAWLGGRKVVTSFIQRLPFSRRCFRAYLPLMPMAIEHLDLSDFDIIISSSHCVAKGVLTRPDQLHISYVHTPMRYAWDLRNHSLKRSKWKRALAAPFLHYLRGWDVISANRVDIVIANSQTVAGRISKYWGRESEVITPPVQVNAFNPTRKRADYFCYMGRLVPYKRVDLLVEAFNRLGLPLLLVGEGPEGERLKRMARPNITFAGWLPDEAMRERLERCRAFVFAGEEDFGIAVVEAQAAGAPVIAFSRGGASETVCDRITGLLYNDQSVDSICEAITAFQNGELVVDHEQISVHAHRFSAERFRAEMDRVVNEAWSSHSGRYVRLLREFAEVKL